MPTASRRTGVALLLILTVALTASACGDDATKTQSQPAQTPTTVTSRTLRISAIPDQDPAKLTQINSAMADYLATKLGVKVEYVPVRVWALLALFVLFPGPLPGAVALGIYNFGILGRLMSEVVENLDDRPGAALRAQGAPRLSVFAYATVPLSVSRFAAYSLYRWEVAARETVVVGIVGAGGLGRLLEQQRSAFDYGGMGGTVIALILVSVLIDFVSAATRRSLR